MDEHGWSVVSVGIAWPGCQCLSALSFYTLFWPSPLAGQLVPSIWESLALTLICDAQSPSLFKKEGDFSHQTQTSQGAVLIDQSNQVDLTLLHTRVG